MEQTLVLLKPDAVQRGLAGELITRFERRGLKIVGLKLMQVPDALARQHYGEHDGKPFFAGLVEYICSSPLVAMVIEGPQAVKAVRQTVGGTDPTAGPEDNPAKFALPGTIRGDYALQKGRNLVHASDSPENGLKEVALWFKPAEISPWPRDTDRWIVE
ncbi:MAG: nucleoside-diphosphate kinase [Dehalococcoidia bacterium]